jgi:glycosyltransferase involved in cell wall biosynthesis
MKIAHIAPEFYPAIGGVGQVVRELSKRQSDEGHEVHVFVPAWDKNKRIKSGQEIIDGIKVHREKYWFKVANFMTFWPSLFPKLLKEKFDVIHSHLFAHPHFVISSLASKISGAKHIHTTHCPWSDAPRSLTGRLGVLASYNLFSRISLKYLTNKVIAITPWEFNFLKKYGAKKEKIINIPNGMSNDFFKKIKNNNFKKKHRIKKHFVLFFGRLNFTKGPEQFVEIAKIILKKRKDIDFLIIGPDEGMKEEVLRRINNEKKIRLIPSIRDRKEIIKMYQSADVYVMPSYREGLPLTLFEAMASGLPIIASPVNGIPYEITNKKNGFLIPYKKNKQFAEKIELLLDNPQLRKQISNNNKKHSKKYSWNLIYKKTMECYNE